MSLWQFIAALAPRSPALTKERLALLHPKVYAEVVLDALVRGRAEGVLMERERSRGVYAAASMVALDPLIERLMFDGKTPPEAAALASVAAMQARSLIVAEVEHRRLMGTEITTQ